MRFPEQPVTLSPELIKQLSGRLSSLRHNVNNHVSLIVAAAELMRRKPEMASRLLDTLDDPTIKITQEVKFFSDELERVLQIRRP